MELDFRSVRFCGRYKELQQLNNVLDQVRGVPPGSSSGSDGSYNRSLSTSSYRPCHKVVMVEGPGGCGKSMLVDHFLNTVGEKQRQVMLSQQKYYYDSGSSSSSANATVLLGRGKFEESSTMPFTSFTECINGLLEDVIRHDPEWSDSLTPDTKREIRRISSIVPNIREILGITRDEMCSTINTCASEHTQQQWAFERARMSLRTLIRTLCSQYTVVLLLDDLQWASEDCIKLISTIATDKHASNLLLLVTHRELGPSTPAFDLKEDLSSDVLCPVKLGDLSPMDICDVVESLLAGRDAEEEDIQGLALVIHSKTGGTCFVVIQFLRLLYERELITYNFHTLRWEFSLDRIASETSICGNVLQLVCDKIARMPKPLQVPMTTAAFLGFSRFDVQLLYAIIQCCPIYPKLNPEVLVGDYEDLASQQNIEIQDLDELRAILALAVKEGMLEKTLPDGHAGEWYRFSHDRVREGALSLVPQSQIELQNLHLQMGLELRRIRDENVLDLDDDELERLLLHAVRHLNDGMSLANAVEERVHLAKMNLQAATVVIERSAFPSALEFLQTGLGLLDEETKWVKHYDLALQLSYKLTHARFCTGQHETNWETLHDVLENAKSIKDKLPAYRTLILSLGTLGRFDEAIETNLAVLEKLGVSLPRNFIKVHQANSLNRIKRKLKGKTEEDLLVYRDHVDESIRDQCDFLGVLTETCVLSGHDDYRVMGMFRATDYIIDYGIEDLAPMAMLGCAYQFGIMGDVESSYKFGKLAAKIAMQGKNPRNDGKAIAIAYESPIAMKEPYHKCLDSQLTAFKVILDNGEIEHLYLPIHAYSTMYFHCGLRLEPLKSDVLRFVEMLESFGQTVHLTLYNPFVELVTKLVGGAGADKGDGTGRPTIAMPRGASLQAKQYYYRYEMILAFYLDDLEAADAMSSQLSAPKVEGPSSWIPPRFFYQGLIEFGICRKTGKTKHRRRGKEHLQKLEKFVKAGNVNCQHMALLLRAEYLSLGREKIDAVQQAYDKAIVSAGKLGFVHDQALGNELAGIHFLARGDRSWACTYLARSYGLFRQWGAMTKARQMEGKYGELLRHQSKDEKMSRQGTFLRGISRAQSIVDSRATARTKAANMDATPSDPTFTAAPQRLSRLSFQQSFG